MTVSLYPYSSTVPTAPLDPGKVGPGYPDPTLLLGLGKYLGRGVKRLCVGMNNVYVFVFVFDHVLVYEWNCVCLFLVAR